MSIADDLERVDLRIEEARAASARLDADHRRRLADGENVTDADLAEGQRARLLISGLEDEQVRLRGEIAQLASDEQLALRVSEQNVKRARGADVVRLAAEADRLAIALAAELTSLWSAYQVLFSSPPARPSTYAPLNRLEFVAVVLNTLHGYTVGFESYFPARARYQGRGLREAMESGEVKNMTAIAEHHVLQLLATCTDTSADASAGGA